MSSSSWAPSFWFNEVFVRVVRLFSVYSIDAVVALAKAISPIRTIVEAIVTEKPNQNHL